MDIEKLNEERKRRGLSIEALANLAELPKSTIEKILFGIVKNPRLDTVEAIERALGLNEKSPAITDETKMRTLSIPEKYKDIRVALNEGNKNLNQDDIDDIVNFIKFKATKKDKK